jgi:hypothetical protein
MDRLRSRSPPCLRVVDVFASFSSGGSTGLSRISNSDMRARERHDSLLKYRSLPLSSSPLSDVPSDSQFASSVFTCEHVSPSSEVSPRPETTSLGITSAWSECVCKMCVHCCPAQVSWKRVYICVGKQTRKRNNKAEGKTDRQTCIHSYTHPEDINIGINTYKKYRQKDKLTD